VRPEGAEVVQIPWNRPEDWAFDQEFEVALQPNGSGDLSGKAVFTGDWAVMARQQFSVEGKRALALAQILGPTFGKHKIEESKFPDLKDISSPAVEVGLKVHVDKVGQVDGSKMTIAAKFVEMIPMGQVFLRLSSLKEREYDMVLLNPVSFSEKADYRVPEGWTVSKLPDSKTIETPFARYSISVEAKDGVVHYRRSMQLLKNRIEKEEYAAFREMAPKINASMTEKIVLEKTAAPAPAPGDGK
jgi:hypothetical protein